MNAIKSVMRWLKNELKKVDHPNYEGRKAVYDLYRRGLNNTGPTTYGKKLKGTILDPSNKNGTEYGKPFRYLTDKEVSKYIVGNNKKFKVEQTSVQSSKKVQSYLNRKNR